MNATKAIADAYEASFLSISGIVSRQKYDEKIQAVFNSAEDIEAVYQHILGSTKLAKLEAAAKAEVKPSGMLDEYREWLADAENCYQAFVAESYSINPQRQEWQSAHSQMLKSLRRLRKAESYETKTKPTSDNTQTKQKKSTQSGKRGSTASNAFMLKEFLCQWHRDNGDAVLKQKEISEKLDWNPAKTSRAFKKAFGENGYNEYKAGFQSEGKRGFINSLNDGSMNVDAYDFHPLPDDI